MKRIISASLLRLSIVCSTLLTSLQSSVILQEDEEELLQEFFSQEEQKDLHYIPTLLATYDPVTNEPHNALSNNLYHHLVHNATFFSSSEEVISKFKPSYKFSLWSSKNQVSFGDSLEIYWSSDTSLLRTKSKNANIIALYCPGDEENPIKFRDAFSLDSFQENKFEIKSFPIIHESTCEFRLLTTPKNKYTIAARHRITIHKSKVLPTQVHIGMTLNPESSMRIHFTTGATHPNPPKPVVRFRKVKSSGDDVLIHGSTKTYDAHDMCNEPATTQDEPGKFISPGLLHTVKLINLEPKTEYEYQAGSISKMEDGTMERTWTDKFSFKTSPVKFEKFSFLAYGDQGVHGESDRITQLVKDEILSEEIKFVLHIGDLSYAKGAAHIWNSWMNMIQSFAAYVPLLVSIGNHEYDSNSQPYAYNEDWWNGGNDSGGECAIPVINRFSPPSVSNQGNSLFWYSYHYLNTFIITISTEHDLKYGSAQHSWLHETLKSVDRSIYPWLIVTGHRPFYNSKMEYSNNRVGKHLRKYVEDLFHEYRVDLVLAGHYHSYLRTCHDLYKEHCDASDNDTSSTGSSPTYITVGTAGAGIRDNDIYDNEWTKKYFNIHGYGKVIIHDDHRLQWLFISAHDAQVKDHFWIEK